MKYLSLKDVKKIHTELEEIYGIDSTILQPSNLESALEAPKRAFFGAEIYRTLSEKSAALMSNLIKLHPFTDGNNRTGFLATLLFLDQNGRTFSRDTEVDVEACRNTAKCTLDVCQLSDWIKNKSRVKR